MNFPLWPAAVAMSKPPSKNATSIGFPKPLHRRLKKAASELVPACKAPALAHLACEQWLAMHDKCMQLAKASTNEARAAK